MRIIFNCMRVQPNDIERMQVKNILEQNISMLINKEGQDITLIDEVGAIFLNKVGDELEVIDFCITDKIIHTN